MSARYKKIVLKRQQHKILFIDHDIFPINQVGKNPLDGHNMVVWNYIKKLKKYHQTQGLEINNDFYLWPGLLFLDMAKIKYVHLDFSPSQGYDTGGNLRFLVNSETLFIEMVEIQDTVSKLPFEVFKMHNKDMFFHISKASNWNALPDIQHALRKKRAIFLIETTG